MKNDVHKVIGSIHNAVFSRENWRRGGGGDTIELKKMLDCLWLKGVESVIDPYIWEWPWQISCLKYPFVACFFWTLPRCFSCFMRHTQNCRVAEICCINKSALCCLNIYMFAHRKHKSGGSERKLIILLSTLQKPRNSQNWKRRKNLLSCQPEMNEKLLVH